MPKFNLVRKFVVIASLCIAIAGCSTQTNNETKPEPAKQEAKSDVPTHVTTKLVYQENLDHWKITLSPYVKDGQWVCDVHAEYLGDTPAQNVSYQLGGSIVKTNGVQPHSGMSAQGYVIKVGQDIDIAFTREENEKEMHGKAKYQVQ